MTLFQLLRRNLRFHWRGHLGVLLGAAVGLRLPGRYGIVSLEGRNLLDSKFDHQDLNFITNERRASSLLLERTILGRLTLSF